ncbi:MAG: DUF4129 domain-containing protein [Anaerovoracaceae bacterium]|jgi:hypothetical protein
MSFARYLRNSIWDMILVTVMIFAISTTVFSGFHVPQETVTSYGTTIVISIILTVILTLIFYDRRSILIGMTAFVIVFLLMIVVLSNTTGMNILRDRESNPYLHIVLQVLVALAVFLPSRTRIGNAIMFVAGLIAVCLVQFLYETNHVVCMLLFILSGGVMQMYRNYIYNIMHSRTIRVAQGSSIRVSTLVCLLAIIIGGGLFYGIVKPMDPPKKDLKIITKYMSLEVLKKVGVATTQTIRDPNLTTSNTSDHTKTSKQKGKKKEDNNKNYGRDKARQNKKKNQQPKHLSKHGPKAFKSVHYSKTIQLIFLLAILIAAAIIAAILIKLWLRRRWFRRLQTHSRREQIQILYMFYLRKFRQLGVKKSPEETPYEFARRAEPQLWIFKEGSLGVSELADLFVRSQYGGVEPTAAEESAYLDFHRYFYRNCREYLGKFKYIYKFFVL